MTFVTIQQYFKGIDLFIEKKNFNLNIKPLPINLCLNKWYLINCENITKYKININLEIKADNNIYLTPGFSDLYPKYSFLLIPSEANCFFLYVTHDQTYINYYNNHIRLFINNSTEYSFSDHIIAIYGYDYRIDQVVNKYGVYMNTIKIKNIKSLNINREINQNLNKILPGIDKIYIINLNGSDVRKNSIELQMKHIFPYLLINIDYEFINPINFIIDNIKIETLIEMGIISSDLSILEENMVKNNNIELGSLSLSIMTYYLFLLAYKSEKNILILEDNIIFDINFITKYNIFYSNLPTKDWQILDLATYNNIQYTKECSIYYNELKNDNLKDLIIPKIDLDKNIKINNDTRAYINKYVMVGCNESGGSKAYVIKPSSFLNINYLPITCAADGIKNWLSGWWNKNSLSYMPIENLITLSNVKSDRVYIDTFDGKVSRNYIQLNDKYINNIIKLVAKFNNIKNYYHEKILHQNNSLHINKDTNINFSNFIDYKLNFTYYDLTKQLCDISKNIKALELQNNIVKYFPTFKINNYYKLNPSIVNLNEKYLLMSYRIYLGNLICDEYNLENCHPWTTLWYSSIFSFNKNITKLNHVGLCLINKTNMQVEKDTILAINDNPYGIEDVRLFENNDNIFIAGGLTTGYTNNYVGDWNDNRLFRQVIGNLGSKNNLINNLPSEEIKLEFNCIKAHSQNMEKNWFGYNDSLNNHFIVNPTYGSFFPLKIYKLNLNTSRIQNDDFNLYNFKKFEIINSINCEEQLEITNNNLINNLNDKYREFTKYNKDVFRLSGGSWGINYDNKILFIGHIVLDITNFDLHKVHIYITNNPYTIISANLSNFIYQRKYQIDFFKKIFRYFSIFFTIKDNKLYSISNGFNIFKNDINDTSINFPLGLIDIGSDMLISFGESDHKTILIKMAKTEIDKLFLNTDADNYRFLTFDSLQQLIKYNKNIIC
jgi:hypothetical protein